MGYRASNGAVHGSEEEEEEDISVVSWCSALSLHTEKQYFQSLDIFKAISVLWEINWEIYFTAKYYELNAIQKLVKQDKFKKIFLLGETLNIDTPKYGQSWIEVKLDSKEC